MKTEKNAVKMVICALAGLVLVGGCNVLESREATIRQASEAIMLKVVDKAKIDQSNLEAHGELKNPEYKYTFFGGTGFYSEGSVQAVGVEIGGQVMGAGVGPAEPDQDMREKIFEILQRDDIANVEKNRMIDELIAETVTKIVDSWTLEKSAESQPSP